MFVSRKEALQLMIPWQLDVLDTVFRWGLYHTIYHAHHDIYIAGSCGCGETMSTPNRAGL